MLEFENGWRGIAKDFAAQVLHRTGLRRGMSALQRVRAGGRRIQLVAYHRVVDDFERAVRRNIPGLLVSKRTFQRQLEEAHRAGYAFASMSEALEVISGRRQTRTDLMVVTFDDGYRDVARHAAPVLRRMGIPAILYVPTGFIGTHRRFAHDRLFSLLRELRERAGRVPAVAGSAHLSRLVQEVLRGRGISAALDDFIARQPALQLEEAASSLQAAMGLSEELEPRDGDVMDWGDLQRWQAEGFEVGAHTVGHVVLTHERPEVIARELRDSKAELERRLGRPIRDFAYCNGWYSDAIIRELVRLGFRSAVTTEARDNGLGADPFALGRRVLWENFSHGALGRFSQALTACQMDGVFNALQFARPVNGRVKGPSVAAVA